MPSRRIFKERILREVQAQQSVTVTNLTLAFSTLPVTSPLGASDRIAILTSGGQARSVLSSTLRTYVLSISGGAATIAEPLTASASLAVGTILQVGGFASFQDDVEVFGGLFVDGSATIGASAAASNIAVNVRAAAGRERSVFWRTGTSARWRVYATNEAESGGNAGSNLRWEAFTDAGALIDSWLTVDRVAGGAATWTRPNLFPAATTSIPSIRLPHGTAPSAPTNGDLWTTTAGLFARINGATASLSGSNTGDQTITLTSDVTGSGTGSFATTIANDAVTYAKMQNVSAASRLLGRGSAAGAGDVQELTIGTGLSLSGTVLSSTVTADVVGPASATDNAVVRFDGTTGKLVQNSSVIITDGGGVNISPSSGVGLSISTNVNSAASYVSTQGSDNAVRIGVSYQTTNGATAGTNAYIAGMSSQVTQSGSGSTVTDLRAGWFIVQRTAGDVTNGVGVDVSAIANTMTNAYGLRIGNVTGGSSTNYAIYTGTGSVRFGGAVGLNSDPNAAYAVQIARTTTQSGTAQAGLRMLWGATSSATAAANGIEVSVNSSGLAGTWTTDIVSSVYISDVIKASGQTITTQYGLRIIDQTKGTTNYAIYTDAGLVRFGDVVNTTESYQVDGVKVVGNQGATISDPTGGTVQDSEARTAINTIIDRLQAHGLIA